MWKTFFVFAAAYVAVTVFTLIAVPHATHNFARWPAAWIVDGLNVLAVLNIPRAIHQGRPVYAFVSRASRSSADTQVPSFNSTPVSSMRRLK